ncbi:hypothetical protein [Xanthomonas euroxanthea]|uniref:hypothetical protein n=2 Tax=Xanthomonas euroxanthea TaxID=2259622 RepID=UPI002E26332D
MSEMAITTGLRFFLGADQGPLVLADYHHDLVLLRYVLAGFELPDEQASACGPIPQVQEQIISGGRLDQAVESLFARSTILRSHRHHAMCDALVLRAGHSQATTFKILSKDGLLRLQTAVVSACSKSKR